MAQYKVPQDVEADDKLLGPFSFRQFVYLMITAGLIAMMVGLFQLFPVLAIIPIPFILFFGIMALPLRRDQPMETYFAALVSYYLKPKSRVWKPGQRDFTIKIMAPKQVENEDRKRTITGEEATHRLSFLADIVDTGGQAIKGMGIDHVSAELALEADRTRDMFETSSFNNFQAAMDRDESQRHQEMVQAMRERIIESNKMMMSNLTHQTVERGPDYQSSAVVAPSAPTMANAAPALPRLSTNPATNATPQLTRSGVSNPLLNIATSNSQPQPQPAQPVMSNNPSIIALANNNDYSVATIEKEAKRIKERDKGEVFISLH